MEYLEEPRRHGSCVKFLSDFRALFIKTFRLAIRKPGQTAAEIILAYTFLGFLLGMRSILDRRQHNELILPPFRPQDALQPNGTGNVIYYYPGLFGGNEFERNDRMIFRKYLCFDDCQQYSHDIASKVVEFS